MDITRATIYFAKGAILVEGISEAILIPALAKRLSCDLSELHISVIPICGVAFKTFKKLLDPAAVGIPVAIVTDGDPTVSRGNSWSEDVPVKEGSAFEVCDRTSSLMTEFSTHPTVRIRHSQVTLEYDLAAAADDNALIMATTWEECFSAKPQTFNSELLASAGADREAKAMAAWRGLCRASHTGSKAELAQRLSAKLAEKDGRDSWKVPFGVPTYLEEAITYVAGSCSLPTPKSKN
jgi:putative ATP-dependent endonuclease of OLD family